MKYLLALLVPFYALAQSGPGGVGNTTSNGLWLKADSIVQADNSPVTNWPDVSGNSNDAGQTDMSLQPTYISSSMMNGMPAVRLDGANDQLIVPDADILDGSAGLTYYAVVRPANLDTRPRGILGKRVTFNVSGNYAYTWFFYNNNRLFNDINTSNDRYSTTSSYANANNYIVSFDFDGSQPQAERARMYENGAIDVIDGETSAAVINSNQELTIGALNENYGTYLGADYGEVIQFNFSLDSLEHIIVSNYLSSKYDIALSAVDLYNEDLASAGNYDHDVTAIGQIDMTMRQDEAQGCSILKILQPSDLNDNEYLFWGHDNQAQVASNTSDVPGLVESRFERVWRASEVDGSSSPIDVGAIDLQWDLSSLGPVVASNLVLLVDTDNDGNFADETPIAGASNLGGGVFEFAGVTEIEDNLRFTIGFIDQSPLPVEYSNVSIQRMAGANVISWTTSEEVNNNYFTIERSQNARNWVEVANILSKSGRNQGLLDYEFSDLIHNRKQFFYRIKQTDFNGNFTYSKILTIEADLKNKDILIFPNPVTDFLNIEGAKDDFIIYDISSRPIFTHTNLRDRGIVGIDLSELEAGIYYIRFKNGQSFSFLKI